MTHQEDLALITKNPACQQIRDMPAAEMAANPGKLAELYSHLDPVELICLWRVMARCETQEQVQQMKAAHPVVAKFLLPIFADPTFKMWCEELGLKS